MDCGSSARPQWPGEQRPAGSEKGRRKRSVTYKSRRLLAGEENIMHVQHCSSSTPNPFTF